MGKRCRIKGWRSLSSEHARIRGRSVDCTPERGEVTSGRWKRSHPSSWPYHPSKTPSKSSVILRVSGPMNFSSEISWIAVVTDGNLWPIEMLFRRSSNRSQAIDPCSVTNFVLLLPEWNASGRGNRREQSSLVCNDFFGCMIDTGLSHAGDIGSHRPNTSRWLDSTWWDKYLAFGHAKKWTAVESKIMKRDASGVTDLISIDAKKKSGCWWIRNKRDCYLRWQGSVDIHL